MVDKKDKKKKPVPKPKKPTGKKVQKKGSMTQIVNVYTGKKRSSSSKPSAPRSSEISDILLASLMSKRDTPMSMERYPGTGIRNLSLPTSGLGTEEKQFAFSKPVVSLFDKTGEPTLSKTYGSNIENIDSVSEASTTGHNEKPLPKSEKKELYKNITSKNPNKPGTREAIKWNIEEIYKEHPQIERKKGLKSRKDYLIAYDELKNQVSFLKTFNK